ncbi:hypothetical protein [Agromyces humi]|uniref:hypothetical protein n=1 Tax=Agromyces humi TaxID=1766800 RepID=UPI0013578E7C|nr:hypothetical protein [Agromyces humi]
MLIANTTVESRHPWPAGMFIQGGGHGIVLSRSGGDSYRTAFVEAFPEGTFIRGEGATVEDAEDAAWAKFQRYAGCPGHEWETRGYRNGAGFCKHCGKFGSQVFDLVEIGSVCDVCGVGTYWTTVGDKLFCEEHAPAREERVRIEQASGVQPSAFTQLLEWLAEEDEEDGDGDGDGAS